MLLFFFSDEKWNDTMCVLMDRITRQGLIFLSKELRLSSSVLDDSMIVLLVKVWAALINIVIIGRDRKRTCFSHIFHNVPHSINLYIRVYSWWNIELIRKREFLHVSIHAFARKANFNCRLDISVGISLWKYYWLFLGKCDDRS